MNRRLVVIGAALVAAFALVYLLVLRPGGDDAPSATRPGPTTPSTGATPAPPTDDDPAPPAPPRLAFDDDPVGTLPLEGQVIDADEAPVAGATVTLSSSPPRFATTEADGGFSFDKLIGKTYYLSARSGALVGGPVAHALSPTSGPVVVRVQPGATVTVETVSAEAGAPLAGVTVGIGRASAVTDATGKAKLVGVATGWGLVYAQAEGRATAQVPIEIPTSPGVELSVKVELHAGAKVAGVVVDARGNPLPGARVMAQDAAAIFAMNDPRSEGVASDAQGRFALPAVPAGSHRFVAWHEDHPTGSTEAMATDGQNPIDGVRIQLDDGATLRGKVIDGAGAPVAWAEVRVGVKQRGAGFGGQPNRSALSEQDGRFTMKGMGKTQVQVLAVAAQASSQTVDVDLGRPPAELVLVVDLAGAIAGVVVDGKGEPVADVQVTGIQDYLASDVPDLALRGPTLTTTDGGGGFALRGLPDGAYRLSVARGLGDDSPFTTRSTKARTGDKNVRLVLEADGGLRGRVLYPEGDAPAAFTVATGFSAGVPVASADGRFTIPGVAPGRHDVRVRGVDFAETTIKDVVVEAGQTRDLGTLTVKRGRLVSGRVLSGDGKPVAGATVAIATQLVGDGQALVAELGEAGADMRGLKRAVSDDDGKYVLRGVGETKPLVIAADHPRRGRSVGQIVAPGPDSSTVDLTLAPTGGVKGRVMSGGEPAAGITLFAAPVERSEINLIVTTDERGRYLLERMAPGAYQVSAMVGSGMNATMVGKAVTIVGGKTLVVDLTLEVGDVELDVTVTPETGTIDATQVFLFKGEVAIKDATELQKVFVAQSAGGAKMGFALGRSPAKLADLKPGPYTVCMIPITGDMNDPQFIQRLQSTAGVLEVHCRKAPVAASPKVQAVSFAIPPMKPLPE